MRTLAQLRTDVLAALGFIDPFASPPTRTLTQLIASLKDQLGLADPMANIATRTLANLRIDVLAALGFAAQSASPPTGMLTLVDEWINNAQDTLWRRLELDKGTASLPSRLSNTSDTTTLDFMPVLNMAISLGKAHLGKSAEAKAYMDLVEKWLADEAQRNPPNIDGQLTVLLQEAQQTAYRRYEMASGSTFSLNTFATGSDSTTIDYMPVYLLALANMALRLQRADAKAYMEQYERYMAELEKRMPANARAVVTMYLKNANRDLYRRYPMLETERFFTYTLVDGQATYALGDDDEAVAGQVLDARKVTWAGIKRDDQWYPLVCGIPPTIYSGNVSNGWPTHYEIRDEIELWPTPDATAQELKIKGHFGLLAFTADDDLPTVDDEAVFLQAVAQAKAFYRQPDAELYVGLLENFVRNVVAGSHNTRRYIPGDVKHVVYVEPKPSVPFA